MANENGLLSESIVYCTALYLAAQNGHKDVVKYISELPIKAKAGDLFKVTAFYLAAMNGNLNILESFTTNKVKFVDDVGNIVLEEPQLETFEDNTEQNVINEIVQENNDDDEECADLFEAAKKGNRRQMELFLNNGVEIDGCDDSFNTALHIAAENANSRAVQFLIGKGANLKSKNKESNTPFHVAAKSGSVRILETMLEKGALINISNSNWNLPIHLACENGHEDVVKLLIEKGADVKAKNKQSNTPLHFAVKSGSSVIVKDLLKSGADVHAKNSEDESVLVHANDEIVINLLVQNGADLAFINKYGRSLLHCAAQYDYPVLAEFLIRQGLEIDKRDNGQRIPLGYSANYGSCSVMQILLMNGADIERKGLYNYSVYGIKHDGQLTPLLLACNKNYEQTELLLENRAYVDATSDYGETALMRAANDGKYEIVKLLLIYGANKDLKCSKNRTALEYAKFGNHEKVVKLLTEWKI